MTAPVFLINLDDSPDRLAGARAMLAAAGMQAERIPAFDGRHLPLDQVPGHDPARAFRYMGRSLRGGELGCYHSHLRAAQAVVDSGADLAVVLEDDMAITPAGAETLRGGIEWLRATGTAFDLMNVGHNRHKLTTVLHRLPGGTAIERAWYFPMTTSGLVWSRKGAQAFLAQPLVIDAPVDNHFRRWLTRTGTGLAMWPAPVGTTGADSLIDSASAKRSHEGRHVMYGLRKQQRLMTDKALAVGHIIRHRLR